MPFPVQIRRLSEALVRRLGLQGHVALTLLEDVQPMLDVFGGGFEARFSRGERACTGRLAATAVVGQFSATAIYMPLGATKFLTVESIISTAVANLFLISPVSLFVDSGAPMTGRDGRLLRTAAGHPTGISARMANRNNAVALVPNLSSRIHQTNAQHFEGWVVTPDTALVLETTAVNTAIEGIFSGYEWQPAPQESVGG